MSKRRSEQIQHGKGKPAETHITKAPDATNPATLPNEAGSGDSAPLDANALGKYWIVIILWAVSFTLMIAFELMAAVFRR